MPSFWEKVNVNGADMDIYASVPDGDGPFPAVVVAQYASGVDKFIQDMAESWLLLATPPLLPTCSIGLQMRWWRAPGSPNGTN